jgi:hypothetical protein
MSSIPKKKKEIKRVHTALIDRVNPFCGCGGALLHIGGGLQEKVEQIGSEGGGGREGGPRGEKTLKTIKCLL